MAGDTDFVDLRLLWRNTGGRNLIIVITIFLVFDFIFISTRFYARKVTKKPWAINDYAILCGFVLSIAGYILQIVQVVYAGLGLEAAWVVLYLGPERLRFLLKCIFASNILFNLCTMAIKISILHLYLTLFGSITYLRRLVSGTILLTVLCHTGIIIELFLLCKPLAYFWDQGLTMKSGSCVSGRAGELAKLVPSVLSTTLDFVIFALPLPVLSTLRMSRLKKFATTAVFAVAFGVVVVSAVRLSYIFDASPSAGIDFAITGCVEPTVGIIVACTPMVRPVIEHLSGGRVVLWGISKPKVSYSISAPWPGSSQKTYVSSGGETTKGFERMEDFELEITELGEAGVMQYKEGRQDTGSIAEHRRIRVTRDLAIDIVPRNMD